MKTVPKNEARLLKMLYAIFEQGSLEYAVSNIDKDFTIDKLSKNTMELLKGAIGKGSVHLLAKYGGWRDERHLRKAKTTSGRLWERTEPKELGLKFSKLSLEILFYTIRRFKQADKEKKATKTDYAWPTGRTDGDALLIFFTHRAFRKTLSLDKIKEVLSEEVFQNNHLSRLAFPEAFTFSEETNFDFTPYTEGTRGAILEALQPELTNILVQLESAKQQISDWKEMQNTGQNQRQVLAAFMDTIEKAGRLDLGRFLLRACNRLLPEGADATMWVSGLKSTGQRLADRALTYQSAFALINALTRMREWTRIAQSVGYFDAEYQAAQLWKADWELYQGDKLADRAAAIVQSVGPMNQVAQEATTTKT